MGEVERMGRGEEWGEERIWGMGDARLGRMPASAEKMGKVR